METLDEVLEHHGIRGMKWGRRKRASSNSSSSGSSSHPGHSDDAARAAVLKEVAKKHGTHALSNQDLQHLVTRMNLEKQFSKVSSSKKQIGAKFAKDILVGVGKTHITNLASDALAKGVGKALKK